MEEIDKERLKDIQEESIDLFKEYLKGSLTTSDFQGCLEGIVNKYFKRLGTR